MKSIMIFVTLIFRGFAGLIKSIKTIKNITKYISQDYLPKLWIKRLHYVSDH